jgi:hypothetical protein
MSQVIDVHVLAINSKKGKNFVTKEELWYNFVNDSQNPTIDIGHRSTLFWNIMEFRRIKIKINLLMKLNNI